jgi:AraC-like DNA-binding protein
MKHYKTLVDFLSTNRFPPAENPLVALLTCNGSCSLGETEFTADFYMIGLKKLQSGSIVYGRTPYDPDSGSMYFVKPRQVIQFRDLQLQEQGYLLFIHEDFLHGSPLHDSIRQYGYFEYEINEALHLSPKEEDIIQDLFHKIETEQNSNTDEYSKDIMLSHIDSILKYSQRFYRRQFIHRSSMAGKTVSKFNAALDDYTKRGFLDSKGLPSVQAMAAELNLSARYLSDLLKQETGKTAMDLIHLYLIGEAKNRLKGSNETVSEIAYALGFENLPYFSRLFKKETGISPVEFKKQLLN